MIQVEKQNSKKKFDLSTDMVKIETSDQFPVNPDIAYSNNVKLKAVKGTLPPVGKTKLTLSVPEDFVPEYKSWCIKHKMTMSDATLEAFKLLKQKYGY